MAEPLRTTGKRKIEMTTAEWIGRLVTAIPPEYKEGYGEILKLREEKEIKSAVEWLKEEIKRDKGNTDTFEIIDKAFEDVLEKTNTGDTQ